MIEPIIEYCPECGKDIITDGKIEWCGEMCIQNGKRGKEEKDYMGFISDLIK
jgi:predicted nucleic acid-binding Zn ribbon protein